MYVRGTRVCTRWVGWRGMRSTGLFTWATSGWGCPAPGERRVTLNYARVFVNKAASYLLSKPIGYNAVPMVEAEARANLGALLSLWR